MGLRAVIIFILYWPLLSSCQVAASKWGYASPFNCHHIYVVCYNTVKVIQLTICKPQLVSVLLHTRTNSREGWFKMHKCVFKFFMNSLLISLLLRALIKKVQRQQRNSRPALLLWQLLATHWLKLNFTHFTSTWTDKYGFTLNVSKVIAKFPLCIMSLWYGYLSFFAACRHSRQFRFLCAHFNRNACKTLIAFNLACHLFAKLLLACACLYMHKKNTLK